MGILQLQERRRVALFVRRDAVGRFATCLVLAPRERFDAALSDRFAAILEHAWNGKVTSVESNVSSDSALGQSLYTLKLDTNDTPTPDLAELERQLAEAATSWGDHFRAALQASLGEVEGRLAARRWGDRFPRPIATISPPRVPLPISNWCDPPLPAARSACAWSASPASHRIAFHCACSTPASRSPSPTSCRRWRSSASGC